MSRLAQLIRRTLRREPAPLGFGVGPRTAPPPMLVVAMPIDGEGTRRALDQGADALLFPWEAAQALGPALKEVSVPWGVRLAAARADVLPPLREAGMDFLVLGPRESEARVLLGEGLGLVAEPLPEASDLDLRLLGELPLDAFLLEAPSPPLTVAQLMALRRLTYLCRLPALAIVPPEADPAYLRSLLDVGVVAAVTAPEGVSGLRQALASLPPGRRREERPEPIVPLLAPSRAPLPAEEPQEPEESASPEHVYILRSKHRWMQRYLFFWLDFRG